MDRLLQTLGALATLTICVPTASARDEPPAASDDEPGGQEARERAMEADARGNELTALVRNSDHSRYVDDEGEAVWSQVQILRTNR